MRSATVLVLILLLSAHSIAATIISQSPVTGGGNMRWSKLWIDPSPAGNNMDGDAICYDDFVLSKTTSINHIEWWGDAKPDLGFQIEFWKQDPGTNAYQPNGVYREQGAQPEAVFTTTGFTTSTDPSGTTHYSLNLANPITLAANDTTNPRWFAAIIGLTDVSGLEWNWAQGVDSANNSFQFIRGGNNGGDLFRTLQDGRAFLLADPTPVSTVPEASSLAGLGIGLASLTYLRRRR